MDPIVDAAKSHLDIPVNAWMAACLGVGVLAIVVAFVLHARLLRLPRGPEPMQRAGRAIHLGLRGFARTHFTAVAASAVIGAVALLFAFNRAGDAWSVSLSFLVGCTGSALAGILGLRAAGGAGVRAAQAASTRGMSAALRASYVSGAAAALFTAGFGMIAVTALWLGTGDPRRLTAFALGAAVSALLARVGGGVFAKAADVGLSLATKQDQDIPDDSVMNPGVIADDAGDCAGDVTAMGADLFESVAGAVVAAMALGAQAWEWTKVHEPAGVKSAIEGLAAGPETLVLFPVTLFAAGIVAAAVAALFVKTDNERKVGAALLRSQMVAAVLMVVGAATMTFVLGLGRPEVTQALTDVARDRADDAAQHGGPVGVLWAVLIGLALGIVLGRLAEWNTSEERPPARKLAEESAAGPATNVLAGLALGMGSVAWPALLLAVAAGAAYYAAGSYGVALAAVGLLSTFAAPYAIHAFGAVAENACGIAEMVRLGPETRRRTDALDAAAATTACIGKGYATGAAALTSIALLAAFRKAYEAAHPGAPFVLDLGDVQVELGLLIGAAAPFVFAGGCIRAVNRVARTLGDQIVQHFRETRPLGEEAPAPDYAKFVAGGARRALRRMGPVALLALLLPVVCGFSPLGPRGLAGMLHAATVTGTMLAFALTNSGGAWDSAKRYVASGVFGGKGSPAYRASVTGDLVGDPMKDAAGPGLHTLLKIMILISLVLLPLFPV